MRAVIETIGGREVELRLTFDALDRIAVVNPQFGEVLAAFRTQVWDWREVTAILREALRPHGITPATLYDERGVEGCRDLARRVFEAAVKVEAGNGEAAAKGGEELPSRSPTSSETA